MEIGAIVTLGHPRKFGFLRTEDGRKFFFAGASVRDVGFDSLAVGDVCEFRAVDDDPRGPRAEDVTVVEPSSFEREEGVVSKSFGSYGFIDFARCRAFFSFSDVEGDAADSLVPGTRVTARLGQAMGARSARAVEVRLADEPRHDDLT